MRRPALIIRRRRYRAGISRTPPWRSSPGCRSRRGGTSVRAITGDASSAIRSARGTWPVLSNRQDRWQIRLPLRGGVDYHRDMHNPSRDLSFWRFLWRFFWSPTDGAGGASRIGTGPFHPGSQIRTDGTDPAPEILALRLPFNRHDPSPRALRRSLQHRPRPQYKLPGRYGNAAAPIWARNSWRVSRRLARPVPGSMPNICLVQECLHHRLAEHLAARSSEGHHRRPPHRDCWICRHARTPAGHQRLLLDDRPGVATRTPHSMQCARSSCPAPQHRSGWRRTRCRGGFGNAQNQVSAWCRLFPEARWRTDRDAEGGMDTPPRLRRHAGPRLRRIEPSAPDALDSLSTTARRLSHRTSFRSPKDTSRSAGAASFSASATVCRHVGGRIVPHSKWSRPLRAFRASRTIGPRDHRPQPRH